MSYVSVMVHVDIDESSDDRVRLAADLARRLKAKLIGVSAAVPQPPFTTDGAIIDVGLLEGDRKRVRQAFDHAEKRFRSMDDVSRDGVEWRAAIDFPNDFLTASACAADLLVIGRENLGRELSLHYAINPGDVVMKGGRPVLVVPPGAQTLRGRRVLVAWRNTREARRAAHDALPLLVQAEEVVLLGVDEGSSNARSDLEEAAAHIRLHGVSIRTDLLPHRGGTVADELFAAAKREGADLIVAGAYGHSRMREWAFGGVTRDLLMRSPVCCLLAH